MMKKSVRVLAARFMLILTWVIGDFDLGFSKCTTNDLRIMCREMFNGYKKGKHVRWQSELTFNVNICSDEKHTSAYILSRLLHSVLKKDVKETEYEEIPDGTSLPIGPIGNVRVTLKSVGIEGAALVAIKYTDHTKAFKRELFNRTMVDSGCNSVLYWINSGPNVAFFVMAVWAVFIIIGGFACFVYNGRVNSALAKIRNRGGPAPEFFPLDL